MQSTRNKKCYQICGVKNKMQECIINTLNGAENKIKLFYTENDVSFV